MALFSYPPDRLDQIQHDLEKMISRGFAISLHDVHPFVSEPDAGARALVFQVRAMDHPGGVRKIVHLLHAHEVNIIALDTRVKHAPVSGAPLFDLNLEAQVPAAVGFAQVKAALVDLARQMDFDLRIID